jgi:hypothetical protein
LISTIFRVVFTIGQTLPAFPAFIGTPDGYPLHRLVFEIEILCMASAQNLALGPFLLDCGHVHQIGTAPALSITGAVIPMRQVKGATVTGASINAPSCFPFLYVPGVHSRTSYSKAMPSGSFSSNQVSAASVVAKTLT